MSEAMDTTDAVAALARRLDHLFTCPTAPGGRVWTNPEMVAQLATRGVQVTPAYLSMLRHGKRKNPSLTVMTGLASVFEVPTAYFYDPGTADRFAQDLQLLAAVRRAGLAQMVLRAAALSSVGRREIAVIVEAFRRIEGVHDSAE